MNSDKSNEIIVSLLARQVFGKEKIKEIVTNKKRNPAAWIKGYNSCDGKTGVVEIAKRAGVSQPNATVILKSLEDEGILYNVGSETKPLYKRLMKL